MYEAQIQATAETIAAYKASQRAEAKVIARLSSLQRSAKKGEAASDKQRRELAEAHTEAVKKDIIAQQIIQDLANRYLE